MKTPTLYIFVLLLVLASGRAFGQSVISGVVTDSINNPVPYATVFAKNDDPQGKNADAVTNEQGRYSLTVASGNYTVQFSALFYSIEKINLQAVPGINYTHNIVLREQATQLDEVIIQSEKAITVKEDTIVFDAKAFAQGNEQVVEDLLKKIPGLTVTADGIIKVGGQEVEKVMIDGDDFFEKGYKLLTKNMPVNPVDKVELLQHYSNNKLLKGVEQSEKVALNLTLKDDYKRQWFGNISGGYGLVSENRYELRTNVMNFGKKNKYYFLGNVNNTGIDATGDINHLIRPYKTDEPGGIGDDQFANTLLSLNMYQPQLKQKRVNFNNAEMVSLNAIYTLSPKVKLKTLGFFNSDENSFFRNSYETFFAGGTNFTNTEKLQVRNNKITGFGKAELAYDISKTKVLQYTGKFNSTGEKGRSNLLFNGDFLNEKLRSQNQLIDQHLVFTNKVRDSKALILSARYINEETPQNYGANQFIYQELFGTDADNVKQYSQNKMQYGGVQAQLLTRGKNGGSGLLEAGSQIRFDDLTSYFKLYNGPVAVLQPQGYQNDVQYVVSDTYLKGSYRFVFKKFALFSQLDLHQFYNELQLGGKKSSQAPFFINPRVGLEWAINAKNKIKTSYSFNQSNATVMDVYNNYIQTDFRVFSKGTGTFNQLDASSASLNYNYGSWGDNFFAHAFIVYTKNHDFFSTNTRVEQNFSQSEKIIIKNREFLLFSAEADRYIKPISATLKATFGGSQYNYKNIVNNSVLREVTSTLVYWGLEVRSGFSGVFNYHIGSRWDYTEVKTTVSNSYTNNTSFLDLSFVFSDKFDVEIQSERYHFGNMDSGSNKYYFMDLDARYTVKQNKLTFSLSGQNLFDTKTFRNYSVSDISTSTIEYRLMPRYVLLKMEYRF